MSGSDERFSDLPDDYFPEAGMMPMFCGPETGRAYARNLERRQRAKSIQKQAVTMWAPVKRALLDQGLTRMEATEQFKAEHPDAHDAMFPWARLRDAYRAELAAAQDADQAEYAAGATWTPANSAREAYAKFVQTVDV